MMGASSLDMVRPTGWSRQCARVEETQDVDHLQAHDHPGRQAGQEDNRDGGHAHVFYLSGEELDTNRPAKGPDKGVPDKEAEYPKQPRVRP
jgi:hypothetical protein